MGLIPWECPFNCFSSKKFYTKGSKICPDSEMKAETFISQAYLQFLICGEEARGGVEGAWMVAYVGLYKKPLLAVGAFFPVYPDKKKN